MFKDLFDSLFDSYKTTLGGVLALFGAIIIAASDYVEAAADNFEMGALLMALGTALVGFFGRDNRRKSEKLE